MKNLILIFFTFVLLVGCPGGSSESTSAPVETPPAVENPPSSGCSDFIIGISSLGDACLK